MKFPQPLLISVIAISTVFAAIIGCSDGSDNDSTADGDKESIVDGDNEYGDWDPGEGGHGGCDGYGYGYDGNCEEIKIIDCSQDPCVFGVCIEENTSGKCECQERYAGKVCDKCAEGFVVSGLRCVKRDACTDFPCVHGTCRVLNDKPVCECEEGYTGDNCDLCADGYHEESLKCVKNK